MKTKTRTSREKPVYFTLPGDYGRQMQNQEARQRLKRGEIASRWVQERLDVESFPGIDFRTASDGARLAVIRGTRIFVWSMALVAKTHGWGAKLEKYFGVTPESVAAAEGYASRHRREIESLIAANEVPLAELKRQFPKLRALDEIPD